MSWLVTGGAGYVGAHVVHALLGGGSGVVVLDDLSTGDPARLGGPGLPGDVELVKGSVHDGDLLARVMREYGVRGVVHLAAQKQPGESVEQPVRYYRENVGGLASLLDAMAAVDVTALVFSSSAAVYGTHETDILTEDSPCRPYSPYGETKLAGEWLLRDVARISRLRYVTLRYFNAAGAARPELADTCMSNLIPMVFEPITAGRQPVIFGDDYPTPDGTCVRDYVHVADIAAAHVAATGYLASRGAPSLTLNVGTGRGVSVRQMVDTILAVSGSPLSARVAARRPGDPPVSIASAERIRRELGWVPQYDLEEMVRSAWAGWRHHHAGVTPVA